ncbi:MAG: DUF1071 domain-containing protein [Fusobacteriaceae bacterium]
MDFKKLYSLDIKGMVEKVEISSSRSLSYLSWANAVKIATELDNNFSFEFIINEVDGSYLFPQSIKKNQLVRIEKIIETTELVPVVVLQDGIEKTLYEKKSTKQIISEDVMQEVELKTTYMVRTRTVFNGIVREMTLPIMDNKNNSVHAPDSRNINDSLMRCLAKNIALYGIGLALYTGEDLEQFVVQDLLTTLKKEVMSKYKNNPESKDTFKKYSEKFNKMVRDFNLEELQELNKELN